MRKLKSIFFLAFLMLFCVSGRVSAEDFTIRAIMPTVPAEVKGVKSGFCYSRFVFGPHMVNIGSDWKAVILNGRYGGSKTGSKYQSVGGYVYRTATGARAALYNNFQNGVEFDLTETYQGFPLVGNGVAAMMDASGNLWVQMGMYVDMCYIALK